MLKDAEHCSNMDCGCHIWNFPASKTCPTCRRRLRIIGRPQLLEFRLSCPNCSYHSPLLSQEELEILL